MNDRLVIENIERYPNTTQTIHNRWGRKMYGSSAYRNGFGGENVSAGVF